MDNFQIADTFSLLAKLMDIHGENSFKSKSYASAAFSIEKINVPLAGMSTEKISAFQGIGLSTAQKISELLETGRLTVLEKLIAATPDGVLQMMQIKGIGPKKINAIWKSMEIESIGELLYACKENRLKLYKGFGEKTQQNIIDAISFFLQHQGSHLFADAQLIDELIFPILSTLLAGFRLERTGQIPTQPETVDRFDYITTGDPESVISLLQNPACKFSIKEHHVDYIDFATNEDYPVRLWLCNEAGFIEKKIETGSSVTFWEILKNKQAEKGTLHADSEEAYFNELNLPHFPAFLRDEADWIHNTDQADIDNIIQPSDIRGIIHAHSNWSDGSHSLEEMATKAKASGLEYLVISDHSRSAFYAQGLSSERVMAQHQQIDELNPKLAPFKIFKSIESDILNDGSLDYDAEILSKFDLVIASVHSNLKMDKDKAMARLIRAIENPYTTILGHMTGRLLLSRAGYPVDHERIIDACASNQVAIELNAHPRRLDMSWKYIRMAVDKGVIISINPDAHSTEGFADVKYGVYAAQKAMLSPNNNLSSYSLPAFEHYLKKIKRW
jgi:DNA polymerase (family 10)